MTGLDEEDRVLGRYDLLHELGRGGMSIVYLAKDRELGREVAIKCVSTSNKSNFKLVERLRSEAKLLAQLNHPNIVQLYDVVEQGSTLGLVIEYVGGETLTQRLKHLVSREVKLKWLAEIAEGLASAHAKGIAHCDLKADNVLITDTNVAKIADFGIAKVKLDGYLEDDGLTRLDNVSGSYYSLSPEQATGQPVDTKTDLFSLAILSHQSLVGEHPFGDTHNKIALVQRIISTPFELNSRAHSVLGERLSELIKNLLSKEPAGRIYTAKEAAGLLYDANRGSGSYNQEGETAEIPTQFDNSRKKNEQRTPTNLVRNSGLLLLGFVFGFCVLAAYDYFSSSSLKPSYVAIGDVEIEMLPSFNAELLPFLESTIQETAEQAILSLDNTNLISQREFAGVQGTFLDKAKATGISSIITVSAKCDSAKCDLTLRKYAGAKMAVTAQKNWPLAVQSLTGMRTSLSGEVFAMFPNIERDELDSTISEQNYRSYLDLFLSSKNGKKSDPKHLTRLEVLVQQQPFFEPAYGLASRVAEVLYSRNKMPKYLVQLESILEFVPHELESDPEIINALISLKLLQNKSTEAQAIFDKAKTVISDQATLINLETDLAFYGNELERLLELDRKNVTLRPSAKTYYNLAHSEYSFGNYSVADRVLDQALLLHPTHSFAINMKGSLAMRSGNLDMAIRYYQRAIAINPTATSNSNLGQAYTLLGDYDKAIEHIDLAHSSSPNSASFLLGLADAHKLAGDQALAERHYKEVVRLTEQPDSLADFRYRTLALAQSGDFVNAIKVLNRANKKYPNQAYLKYSAAVVHSLSNNEVAALVGIEEALNQGTGKIWFSLPWFEALCDLEAFKNLTSPDTDLLCIN